MSEIMSVSDFNKIKAGIGPKKKAPVRKESKLQRECVAWFRCAHKTKLLFAIPNGGKRGAVEAKIMQGEGVVAGVADLQLLWGNGEYFSLFIEMKVGKNGQTDKQKEFQAYCDRNRFKYVVCRTANEFIKEVNDYLKT